MIAQINVRKKHWLVPFLRLVTAEFDADKAAAAIAPYQSLPRHERTGAWLEPALRQRSLILDWNGLKTWRPPDDIDEKDRGAWFFLTTLASQVELLMEMRLLLDLGFDALHDQLAILVVLAAHGECFDEADELYEFTLDEWGDPGDSRRNKLARKMGGAMKTVGSRLADGALHAWNQPLLGLPFHQFLTYADTRQLASIAEANFLAGGRLDSSDAEKLIAQAHNQRISLVEAVFALAGADGVISSVERRMVENAIELAGLGSDEQDMIFSGVDDPVTPANIAARITDPVTRRFTFEQVLVYSQLDGEVRPEEETFIEALAEEFEYGADQRLLFEAQSIAYLEAHPELMEAFSLTGMVRRFRAHLTDRVERAVRVNLERIVTEIRETGELAPLMFKRAQGDLTPEEEARMKEQLIDICKTVPALAVFAVPGGSVLLPILMKVLPFEILPSAFVEKEESL